MSSGRALWIAGGAGVLLGIVSRASDLLPREVGWVGNVGAVWLLVAFAVGALGHPPVRAALGGAVALSVAALTHYVPKRLMHIGMSLDTLRSPLPEWIVVGLALGALYGYLGQAWRRGPNRAVAVAGLASAFGAEAVYLLFAEEPNALVLAAPLELAIVLLLPLVLLSSARERLVAAAWCLPMTVACSVSLLALVDAVRRVY